jgi:hypothetical protein
VPLSEDLDRIDVAIRQLQVKWEMFFAGSERKPPTELQSQVDALIKRHANSEIRNNGERFRYQGLTARFTSFSELWQKKLRAREEGKLFGVHGLRAEQLPIPAPRPAPPPAAAAGTPSGEFRIANAQQDQAAIRALYETFVAQKRQSGDSAAPAFESFRALIAQQTERIRADKGARAVDFRLEAKDGKVSLKARVVK